MLTHRQEVEEPFEAEQVGSSAMPYKRNPMRAERMCGLARFVLSLTVSAAQTAATQWLERSLDDSVNRRLTLPQGFLACDGVLRLLLNISNGLVVNPEVITRNVRQTRPYMLAENVLMTGTAAGGDRQELHEALRHHSQAATARLKAGAADNDLLERLKGDAMFAGVDFARIEAEGRLAGRALEQVDEFLAQEFAPIRVRYRNLLGQNAVVDL